MKNLVLLEIMLLSTTEKKAKRVRFDPKRTLIFGGNGTGKSCLIKSIYKTLGATPIKEHPIWKQLNPISFLRFEVNGIRYSILKDGKFYSLFDSNDRLIKVFQGVTKELGPYLANIFDFKIKLANKDGEIVTPPPAFLFLPYYIDQDSSWQNNWCGFAQLQYIKNSREPIVSYHTGLKPNEYYITKGEIENYATKIKMLDEERKILQNLLSKVKEQMSQIDFNVDIEQFKEEVKDLLVECDTLKNKQEQLKSKLVEYYNYKIVVESQLVIAKNALNENRKDYVFANEVLVEDHVDCPTCGAHYENSFVERFEIAKDEDRCKELIIELTRESKEIDDKIIKENAAYNRNNEEIIKIEALLEHKKGEIRLKDIIDSAGRNELRLVFEENSRDINQNIFDNAAEQKRLQDKLKSFTDKSRREQIMAMYHDYMKKYLFQLDVKSLTEDSYKKIDTKIPETGSALPRALIAYYFSIFQVMNKYTTSTYCPLIIDSPNQQAQDLGHIDKILKFINENQPDNSQLILGIEELYNVDFNCSIVELKDEKSLLQKDEYEEVNAELDSYQTKIWNSTRRNTLL